MFGYIVKFGKFIKILYLHIRKSAGTLCGRIGRNPVFIGFLPILLPNLSFLPLPLHLTTSARNLSISFAV